MKRKKMSTVSQGGIPRTRNKNITVNISPTVVDNLKSVASVYDKEFIAGPNGPRSIIEKFCRLFTPEEIFEMMKNKIQSNSKSVCGENS